ncbi:MAG TPA: hypothetical protein VHO02_07980 [Fibrobacteria bacterium]|nr:hypothetical protein [Fibrobacteria bacterium]
MAAVKIDASRELLAALRQYVEGCEASGKLRPAIFAHFPGGALNGTDGVFPFTPDSDRGLAVLLFAAALYRPGGEALAARILAGLYRRYDAGIFKLNRQPFEPLRDAIEDLAPRLDAEERDRIPGILRSVCDFFYRVGPLGPWLASAPDWEMRVGELCNEIYWMGARSRARTKARWFLWLACQAPGFGARHPQALGFDWPAGEGHMRFLFDIVRPPYGFKVPAPEERPAAFSTLARAAFPDSPWRLRAPLEAFLDRKGMGFACRAAQGGCLPCALAPHCPASARFIAEGDLPLEHGANE